jgi:hypothetical protein
MVLATQERVSGEYVRVTLFVGEQVVLAVDELQLATIKCCEECALPASHAVNDNTGLAHAHDTLVSIKLQR